MNSEYKVRQAAFPLLTGSVKTAELSVKESGHGTRTRRRCNMPVPSEKYEDDDDDGGDDDGDDDNDDAIVVSECLHNYASNT